MTSIFLKPFSSVGTDGGRGGVTDTLLLELHAMDALAECGREENDDCVGTLAAVLALPLAVFGLC